MDKYLAEALKMKFGQYDPAERLPKKKMNAFSSIIDWITGNWPSYQLDTIDSDSVYAPARQLMVIYANIGAVGLIIVGFSVMLQTGLFARSFSNLLKVLRQTRENETFPLGPKCGIVVKTDDILHQILEKINTVYDINNEIADRSKSRKENERFHIGQSMAIIPPNDRIKYLDD